MSLILSSEPSRGVVSKNDTDEEACGLWLIGPSNHFTVLSWRSLTESKQIGHLAHLFSEMLK